MVYEKLNEYRYLRDISIAWLNRNSNISLHQLLQKKLSDFDGLQDYFTNNLFSAYKSQRDDLPFTDDWLFPTDEGNFYMPGKFSQNITRMLARADMPTKPSHPKKMSQAQFDSLLGLRFNYQRPVYQMTIASALLGLQALRPEEVANLVKEDVDLDDQTITLRETKGQEPQVIPIHPDLLIPLRNYLNHLEPGDALFVRSTGRKWTRKDVHNAVTKIGNLYGISPINPRRLRSTVAHEMVSMGVPMNVISRFLRHKDEATAPRHYTAIQEISTVRDTLNEFKPVPIPQDIFSQIEE